LSSSIFSKVSPGFSLGRIPVPLTVTALVLITVLGYTGWQDKLALGSILGQQTRLLDLRDQLSRIEQEMLLARNDELGAIRSNSAAPYESFQRRVLEFNQRWHQAGTIPEFVIFGTDLVATKVALTKYQAAALLSIQAGQAMGRNTKSGFLQDLETAEVTLVTLFRRINEPDLTLLFSELRLREKDFSTTLNMSHAEALLGDVTMLNEAVRSRLSNDPAQSALLKALDRYQAEVSRSMNGIIELELADSQSTVRFDRISPMLDRVRSAIDDALQATGKKIQAQRQVSGIRSTAIICGVFITFLLLMLFEMRRAREQLALETKVQQAQRIESLGVLAGSVAHDFKNLLAAIVGNAELAVQALPPESAGRPYMERIETAAMNGADLVNQMLSYSGKSQVVFKSHDLGNLVQEMVNFLRASISKKVSLRLDVLADVTPIRADATQIRQVVMNLIINASEAIGDQEGTISIKILTSEFTREDRAGFFPDERFPEGSSVVLEVSDTGRGMTEATKRRLFDPFFTTKTTGRGLGMAAVLGIIRGHRGAIRVESEPGHGSNFTVLFPLGRKNADAEKQIGLPRGSGTILVIEDDEVTRLVMQECLKKAGFDVLIAEDGRRAVEIFADRTDQITGILLDMSMPQLDGADTFQELRKIQPEVRVILCSGHSEDITTKFEGLAGFIQKPFRPQFLIQQACELFASHPNEFPPNGLLRLIQ
jgi:signal transduction histidine kinase/CheY-like chemotaxis protein